MKLLKDVKTLADVNPNWIDDAIQGLKAGVVSWNYTCVALHNSSARGANARDEKGRMYWVTDTYQPRNPLVALYETWSRMPSKRKDRTFSMPWWWGRHNRAALAARVAHLEKFKKAVLVAQQLVGNPFSSIDIGDAKESLSLATLQEARYHIANNNNSGDYTYICITLSHIYAAKGLLWRNPERVAVEKILKANGIWTGGSGFEPGELPDKFVKSGVPMYGYSKVHRLLFLDALIAKLRNE